MERSGDGHERAHDAVAAAQEADDGERADRERQLPRVEVPFERVRARLGDRVAQRQRRHQRDRAHRVR